MRNRYLQYVLPTKKSRRRKGHEQNQGKTMTDIILDIETNAKKTEGIFIMDCRCCTGLMFEISLGSEDRGIVSPSTPRFCIRCIWWCTSWGFSSDVSVCSNVAEGFALGHSALDKHSIWTTLVQRTVLIWSSLLTGETLTHEMEGAGDSTCRWRTRVDG